MATGDFPIDVDRIDGWVTRLVYWQALNSVPPEPDAMTVMYPRD